MPQSGASRNANPWLTGTGRAVDPEPDTAPASTRRENGRGPAMPQAGVSVPDTADRLPRASYATPATVWWLGVHGGAGESTLTALAAGSRAAQHRWPVTDAEGPASRVALVARTHWSGLIAAQRAATDWASGALGDSVHLLGLVLIRDAPGRLPKPLRDLQRVIGGGVPRVWTLPWVDAWRFGPVDLSAPLRPEFRSLLADLQLSPRDDHLTGRT